MNNKTTYSLNYRNSDDCIIRHTTTADIPRLKEIFAIARRFMAEAGNPNQWTEGYPSEELLQEDIDSGDSYVIVNGDRIVATFVLRGGADPTYDIIYDGKWSNDKPYATIHRIASSGEATGIMHTALQYALTLYDNIRIDTHRDNLVMQHLLADEGFSYCGVIHCWSGDERLAFQLTKKG